MQTRYELTPEHEAQLKPWADKWIANAMSTEPMTEEDRRITREAIQGMYASAGLEPPPPERIVFVRSPLEAAVVAGHAAMIWHAIDNGVQPTDVQRDEPTFSREMDLSHWYVWPREQLYAQSYANARRYGLDRKTCNDAVAKTWRMRNGGNQWSGWCAFLSFFDRVVALDLPVYDKWRHYEQAALHSGPRYMHAKFCVVSDRPLRLLVDDRNRPHCEDGPFCQWADGSALYSIHGVRLPAWIVLHPERITTAAIDTETNAEIRRIMLERYGEGRYLADTGVVAEHEDECGTLYRKAQSGDEDLVMVRVVNTTAEADGSHKTYWLRVPPGTRTAKEGVAWTYDLLPSEYSPSQEA